MKTLFGVMAMMALVGCSDGDGKGPGGGGGGLIDVDGQATGAPEASVVAVAWVVSSGSPDYAYKFGEGTTSGDSFQLSLDANPPAAALNTGGIGIGIVFQLPPGTALPDGMLTDAQLESATGFAPAHSIIFKAEGATTGEIQWLDAFPTGYACGVCVDQDTGFDSYEPTECSNVKIEQSLEGAFCNFT